MNPFKRRTAPLPAVRTRFYFAADFPQPPGRGPSGRKFCRWCHLEVPAFRSAWCGDECVNEYLSIAGSAIREFIFERDGGKCVLCGLNLKFAREIKSWAIEHAREMLEESDWGHSYQLYKAVSRFFEELHWSELTAYETDHIVPLAEGGLTHPDNLRTLCVPCHKAATAALSARLAESRRRKESSG